MANVRENGQKHSGITTENPGKSVDYRALPTDFLLNKDHDAKAPEGWPTTPKPVRSPFLVSIANGAFDFFLLIFSITFLAFALVVCYYDQASTVENPRATKLLLSATKYGPTIFPILFASVVGRAAHAILLWRLEKGENIGILDTLAASTSLTSTITSQFQLRMFSLLGTALICIWALSPIGGQASIRQMTIQPQVSSRSVSVQYMAPDGNIFEYRPVKAMALFSVLSTLLSAAIIAPPTTKLSPRDIWGNVKIPMIEHLETVQLANSDGWYYTHTANTSDSVYSSIVGVPMSTTASPEWIDHSMEIETMYLRLNCSRRPYPSSLSRTGPMGEYNETSQVLIIGWDNQHNDSGTSWPNNTYPPFRFNFATMGTIFSFQCEMTTTYVQVEILCPTWSTCAASRVRRSRLEFLSPDFTLLDLDNGSNWNTFVRSFATSIKGQEGQPSILDGYLVSPNDPISDPSADTKTRNLTESDDVSSLRIGHLINAYWTCMNGMYAIAGGLNNRTSYPNDTITFIPDSYRFFKSPSARTGLRARTWSTDGVAKVETKVIAANKGWVITLAFVSVVLIISSLVSPVVHSFLTKGPDLAMNFSSLATRNNRLIPLPSDGTFLEASHRAKLLKDIKVQFGDAAGNKDVGNLVISQIDESGTTQNIVGIRKGRLYE